MAGTVAPLLSFGASGAIAKTQVYASWRGVKYARRYVVPANPNSTDQQKTRSVFAWASNIWKNGSSLVQAPWTAATVGKPLYNRNAFIGAQTKALRAGTDLSDFVGSPGAGGGLAPESISASAGSGSLTVTVTPPTAPTGWTVASVVAVAIKSGDPHSATDYTTVAGDADASPWEVTLSGLDAALYEVSGWVTYTKPDGSTAYGPSSNTTGTPTS